MANWGLWKRRDFSENPEMSQETYAKVQDEDNYDHNKTIEGVDGGSTPRTGDKEGCGSRPSDEWVYEPPGDVETPVDKPRKHPLVRLIEELDINHQRVFGEYRERYLKRFSQLYDAHNLRPIAIDVSDSSVQIATDGKTYYIVILYLECAAVPVGELWEGAIGLLKGLDFSLTPADLIESIGGEVHPLDEEEQDFFFPLEECELRELTKEENKRVDRTVNKMKSWTVKDSA
ncbi:hypothetical protein AA313_de0207253 [Arthrobotrys entomopaga]|nr:hypothetical protein AA313_de0207253 [Arthrobotrys entomopaga]